MRCPLDSRWVPVKSEEGGRIRWRPSGSRCLVHELPADHGLQHANRTAHYLTTLPKREAGRAVVTRDPGRWRQDWSLMAFCRCGRTHGPFSCRHRLGP
jgi:hypothetical protein